MSHDELTCTCTVHVHVHAYMFLHMLLYVDIMCITITICANHRFISVSSVDGSFYDNTKPSTTIRKPEKNR